MTDNVRELEKALINDNPILFLGAGFSYKGVNSFGEIPTGKELTKEIFDYFEAIGKEVIIDDDYDKLVDSY